MACLHTDRAELQLSHIIATSHSFKLVVSEILSRDPDVIVLLDTNHSDAQGVNQAVHGACHLQQCAVRMVGRHAFDDTVGGELIRKFCCTEESTLESICTSNYLAVGCAGAL